LVAIFARGIVQSAKGGNPIGPILGFRVGIVWPVRAGTADQIERFYQGGNQILANGIYIIRDKRYIQWMPFRDKSGRRILVQIVDSNIVQYAITRVKFLIYMSYCVGENDVKSQQKGILIIVYPGGPGKDWTSRRYTPNKRARHLVNIKHQVIAVRYSAYHFCMMDNTIFRLIQNFIVFCSHLSKSRMKLRIGQDTELRYTLQGFGIPVDLIGTGNKTGRVKTSKSSICTSKIVFQVLI